MAPVVPPVGFSAVGGVTTKVRFFAQNRSRKYRQKVTATALFQTTFHRVFNFSHKWPTFAFTSESGYTLGFRRRIAHNGSHGETGAFRTGPLSLPSTRTARSRTSPGRVSERRTLPLLGLGRVCFRRTQKAFGTAMRSCASLFRRRRGPAGPRDLFTCVEIAACMPCSRYFFRFSRRSSLCRSCASCVSARFFSARSSMVFGRNRQDFLL